MLNEHLSWNNYISVVENEVSKNIGILHKAKNISNKGGLKTLYFVLYSKLCFSFVNRYLNYGNIAWGSTTREKLKKLASKQRQAIRVVSAAKYTREKNGRNESFKYL